jgi:hypothetical protein
MKQLNRREALAAMGLGAVPGLAGANSNQEFRPIDERLSGRLSINQLRDYESGWIVDSQITLSRQDEIFYFLHAANSSLTVSAKKGDPGHMVDTWVGRLGDKLYVLPSEESLETMRECFRVPEHDGWFLRPAQLAYYKAYPLEEKDGSYYVVPAKWSLCKNHPLAQRNVQELKKAEAIRKFTLERYGFNFDYCKWPNDGMGLEKALNFED